MISPKHDDGGFAIVEIIVSMIIFAIIATGATLAIMGGMKAGTGNQNRVSTSNIAQQAIEKAEQTDKATLASATYPASAGKQNFTVTRTVSYTPAGSTSCPATIVQDGKPHAIVVHVKVAGTGQDARTVEMDTVIAC